MPLILPSEPRFKLSRYERADGHSMTKTFSESDTKQDLLIRSLLDPSAYVHSVVEPIVLHETHISWVLLAGNFAYKIKKPIITDFLDYGTLAKRHHACCEEFRLGSRYAEGMYLDIVPITFEDGQIQMDGDAQPIEFAVRMRRFPEDSLLSQQLQADLVTPENIAQLAIKIAGFHGLALKLEEPRAEMVSRILAQANENIELLQSEPLLKQDPVLRRLDSWTQTYFANHESLFRSRLYEGFVRECHGDLHCDNIVLWSGRFSPFDGIEFNSEYSWIDVISDYSFLVMDLQERGRQDLASCFLNAYLEQTGDYRSLSLLRWYMVYRALVRAKVAVIRARQVDHVLRLRQEQLDPARNYLRLADKLTQPCKRHLWITHGVSGSGKTTGSQRLIQKMGAIRIRSDIERKRLFKTSKATPPSLEFGQGMYSPTGSEATYRMLLVLAKDVLQANFPVVVDATFLKNADRQRFQLLAKTEGADFSIIDFKSEQETLRQRIAHRTLAQNDASDATAAILANQLLIQEPLTEAELAMTIDAGTV